MLRPPAAGLVVCPLCQSPVPPAALDDHLRRLHRLYTYNSVHRSLDDTIDAMLDDVVSPRATDVAWQALLRLAREEYGPSAGRFLATRLRRKLGRVDPKSQSAVLSAVAPVVAPGHPHLISTLAMSKRLLARRVALSGFRHLAPPYDRRARRALRGLLADTALPSGERFDALAAALPHLEHASAAKLLSPLLVGQRRRDALQMVERLEAAAGPMPILAALRERFEERVKMGCPRCGIELRRHYMLPHLWERHGLLLDGTRVREPWTVVEEWLDAARATRDRRFVDRCRVAVDKIDPGTGQRRLTRMLLSRDLADAATRHAVLAEARDQHASCCPACFAFVPVPAEQPALAVKPRHDRLAVGGYRVAIDDDGLRPHLEVVTSHGVVFRGTEPDRPWTADGAAFIWSLIVVLAAILCALTWPFGSSYRPVVLMLFAAWVVHYGVRLAHRGQTPAKERLLDFTWRLLVPELHSGGFRLTDSAFAAGLASWYSRHGRTDVPAETLADLIARTDQATERGEAPAGHLAALARLRIELAASEGEDVVPVVTRWVARCFAGKLPLSFAQQLLENWAADWWTKANLARLRVLICDRAFEAGFEVQTLLDAGRTAPALGTVLVVESPRSLAALRLVWSMRPTRPWGRLGEARTAFEIAADPLLAGVFQEHGDVLLFDEESAVPIEYEPSQVKMAPARIQFTLAGVWLQEVIFSIPPRVFEVRRKSFGSQLILGPHVFRSTLDLDPFSARLERWLRWVFHEFLPQVDGVLKWQSPHRAALLRAWGAVPCPECGRGLLPAVGEVGISAEDQVARS